MAEEGTQVDRDWMEEVGAIFARLEPPHVEKKKATILALVDARLAQEPEESVFRRTECCSRNTWHAKWKHDPGIAGALKAVYDLATGWRDVLMVRALQEAAERLALASPRAAEVVEKKMLSADENVALRAAFGVLDRADFSTATKGSQLQAEMDDLLDEEEQAAVAAALRKLAEES